MITMAHSIQQVDRHFVTRVDRRFIRSSPFPDAVIEMLEPRYLFSHHVHAAPPPTPNLALPSQLPIGAATASLFASPTVSTPAVDAEVGDPELPSTFTVTPAGAQPVNASLPTDLDSLLAINNRDTLFGGNSAHSEYALTS